MSKPEITYIDREYSEDEQVMFLMPRHTCAYRFKYLGQEYGDYVGSEEKLDRDIVKQVAEETRDFIIGVMDEADRQPCKR